MRNTSDNHLVGNLLTYFDLARKAVNTQFSLLGHRLERAIERHAAAIQHRWEQGGYDADNALHRLREQCADWLLSMARRLQQSDIPRHVYLRPVVITAVGVALARFFPAGIMQILLAAVIVSVRVAGLRGGLLTALISFGAMLVAARNAIHAPAGSSILVGLLFFMLVAALSCILVDSLEFARQNAQRQQNAAEAFARRSRFLAEASAMLETEYTAESMLSAVVRSCVPSFASWAVADLVVDGSLQRAAMVHKDDGITALMRSTQRGRTLCFPSGHVLHDALNTRQAFIFADVSEEILAPLKLGNHDADGLLPVHVLFVPLTARERLLGALTLISTDRERPFSPIDLIAARDLGLRVGMALDNLRLYCGVLDQATELARREREAAAQKRRLEQERTNLVAQNAILSVEAATDGLTGLLNHVTFQRSLDAQFRRAEQEGVPLSVAMLDVDRFKSYNDTFGHLVGDTVLRHLAAILKESSRSTDVVARYGGEEFVIVMPDTDARQSLEAMERVRQALEDAKWPERPVTASFGVASMRPGLQTPLELVAAADDALYRSKQHGRNRITHADSMVEAVVFQHGFRSTVRVPTSMKEQAQSDG